MNRTITIALTLATCLLLPGIHAGSPASPEITDTAGDAPTHLDIRAAWLTTETTTVTITIKLTAFAPPTTDGNLRSVYRVDFNTTRLVRGAFAEADIVYAETTEAGRPGTWALSSPAGTGVGTAFRSSTEGLTGTATVDADAGLIVLKLDRRSDFNRGLYFFFVSGDVVSDIKVTTYSAQQTAEIHTGAVLDVPALELTGRTLRDATGTASYTVG